jgi:hypothetical protein
MNQAAFESSQTTNGNSNDGHTSESLPPVREHRSMDIIINVEAQCPLHLAPVDYLENNNVLNFDFIYKWKKEIARFPASGIKRAARSGICVENDYTFICTI